LPIPTQDRRLPSPSTATQLPKHVARLQQAQAQFARGELREAEALCERILRKRPSDFDVLYLLAGVRHALGKLPEALDALARALRVNQRSPQILINHGLLLAALGRHDEAVTSYDRATAISPDFAEAHKGRGCVLLDMDRPAEALESFDKALAVKPADAEALSNRASALIKLHRYAEALSSCDRALALRPSDVRALSFRAHALHRLGRHADALAGYEMVLAIDPGHVDATNGREAALLQLSPGPGGGSFGSAEPEPRAPDRGPRHVIAWVGRGNAEVTAGRYREAVAHYDAALAIDKNNVDAWTNRGVALQNDGRLAEALASHDRALSLQPRCANAWDNRAGTLFLQGRTAEAIADYGRALALEPNRVGTLYNRSGALRTLGRFDEATADLDRALAIDPNFAEARFGRSTIQLLRGDLSGAWAGYESRLKVKDFGHWRRSFDKPRWYGEPIDGRTLLLHAEQGLGDTIQFLRYARLLAANGAAKARVVLEVQPPLLRLSARLGEFAQVVAAGERLPDFDLHCPLLSLPLAFGTTLETIPCAVPYLDADAMQVAQWRRRLAGLPGLKVGLAWAGGFRPGLPMAHEMDRRRSITLAHFAAFAAMTGVSFVSLQKDAPAAQTKSPPAGLVVHDWTDELGDFADTAGLVEALDLVISVDTSVAHLAGALGKPVWLLNRFDSEWRWLLDREDSPWYPTLRQFRQPAPGEWEPVLSRVREALAEVAAVTP